MKIGIIGSGISGLSAAHLLQCKHDVEILESKPFAGGIAKVADIAGNPYHLVGGHCLNSKDRSVLDFVFSVFPESEWNKVSRNANIFILGRHLSYPIEFSMRELFAINESLALSCIEDLLASGSAKSGDNLEDWFRGTFGNSLADLYFIPYNQKIWGLEPKLMNSEWVIDKLPIPNKTSFIKSLMSTALDDMVHSAFYYPKDVLIDNLIMRLSMNKNIALNYTVEKITRSAGKYHVNDEKIYDRIVITAPLDISIKFFSGIPECVLKAASLLKYNKISNVLWETSGVNATWTYLPEASTIFHRHIHIGNFLSPRKNLTITEAIGNIPYEVMVEEGQKFEYLQKPLSYNVSDHAYVLQDGNKQASASVVKKFIEAQGIFLCGRFAEWEYYNMDVCIQSALKVCKHII